MVVSAESSPPTPLALCEEGGEGEEREGERERERKEREGRAKGGASKRQQHEATVAGHIHDLAKFGAKWYPQLYRLLTIVWF